VLTSKTTLIDCRELIIIRSILACLVFFIAFQAIVSTEGEELGYFCREEDRQNENLPEIVCAQVIEPSCGWYNPKLVRCFAAPCAIDGNNACELCKNKNVLRVTMGKCPRNYFLQ